MKHPSIVFLTTLTFWATAVVEAHEFGIRELPVSDPPKEVSPEEAKKLQPRPDKKASNVPQPKESGKLAGSVNKQIVGGTGSNRGQWPWQAYVLQDNAYLCGGSLITAQWVLTAGHCAQGRTNFTLSFGAVRRNVFEDGRVQVETTAKYVHPNYNPSNLNNDVALIKLPLPLFQTTSPFIKPVRLPTTADAAKTFEGVVATASGWGRLNSTSSSSFGLNQVNITVIPNTQCASIYGTNVIVSSTLCTSTTGAKSTCQGDSGGPLVYFDNASNAWTQIGVTSFTASNGCDAGYPAGFARVSSFLNWISNTVASTATTTASG